MYIVYYKTLIGGCCKRNAEYNSWNFHMQLETSTFSKPIWKNFFQHSFYHWASHEDPKQIYLHTPWPKAWTSTFQPTINTQFNTQSRICGTHKHTHISRSFPALVSNFHSWAVTDKLIDRDIYSVDMFYTSTIFSLGRLSHSRCSVIRIYQLVQTLFFINK